MLILGYSLFSTYVSIIQVVNILGGHIYPRVKLFNFVVYFFFSFALVMKILYFKFLDDGMIRLYVRIALS